jgi:two-component system, cell cycle sensor histidine kinase and response regulator CckA
MNNFDYTILVVDDEKLLRELIVLMLEHENYHVLVAEHSDEALLKLDAYPDNIHLLLTDLEMDPYMDGCELSKCVRLLRPETRILYISGFTDHFMVKQEVMAGRADFLAKPFSASEIINKVHCILNQAYQKA